MTQETFNPEDNVARSVGEKLRASSFEQRAAVYRASVPSPSTGPSAPELDQSSDHRPAMG